MGIKIRRSSLPRFFLPPGLYFMGISVTGLVALVAGDGWIPVLYASGGATALLAWRLLAWKDAVAKYASFGALFLLVCVLNRVLYIADYALSGTRFEEWPFFVDSPSVAVFKGEVMTVIGSLATVLGWVLAKGAATSPKVVFERGIARGGLLVACYAMSAGAMLIARQFSVVAAALGQLIPTLLGLGLITCYLIPSRLKVRPLQKLILTVLMSLPFLLASAGTGMKENIILALLPSGVAVWQLTRNRALRLGLILFGFTAVGLITSYVNYYRAEVWYSGRHDVTTTEVVEGFIADLDDSDKDDAATDGLTVFLSRNNASWHRGWAVSIADERGHYPELVFSPMLYVFVPRIIWPNKPAIRQGWEYSGLVFGKRYIAWSDSSTAAGFYPSLYLGGGWIALFMGALSVGVLLAFMTRLVARFGGVTAGGLYIFAMLPFVLRLDETWSVRALSGPIISGVYVIGVVVVAKIASAFFRQASPRIRA